MQVMKYFVIIGLIQTVSSCSRHRDMHYSLTTTIGDKHMIKDKIEYCEGSILALRCHFIKKSLIKLAIYHFFLYKCEDITCGSYKVILMRSHIYNIEHVFLLNKSYNNSIYGCGIVETLDNYEMVYKGNKVYVLTLYEYGPPTSTTSSTTTNTPAAELSTEATTALTILNNEEESGPSGSVWLIIGCSASGVVVAGAVALAVGLYCKSRAKPRKVVPAQKEDVTPPDDHGDTDNEYAEVYEDRLRIINRAVQQLQEKNTREKRQPAPLPLTTLPRPSVPSHQMIAPASDMYLLQIDSDGYQIPDEIRAKGIEYDLEDRIN